MAYLRETVAEHDIERHIRFGHHVDRAEWSTDDARWTVTATLTSTGETVEYTCSFLFMCSGYYSYRGGYLPELPGIDEFGGTVVHPQAVAGGPRLPRQAGRGDRFGRHGDDLGAGDGRRRRARHDAAALPHLRRVAPRPRRDRERAAQGAARNRSRIASPARRTSPSVVSSTARPAPSRPRSAAKLLDMVRKELGDEMVEQHFTPRYDPWDQRLCLIPNGDLYEAIKSGQGLGRHRPHRHVHAHRHPAAVG
jgi:monooxygenase